jgi:hypothetical protein
MEPNFFLFRLTVCAMYKVSNLPIKIVASPPHALLSGTSPMKNLPIVIEIHHRYLHPSPSQHPHNRPKCHSHTVHSGRTTPEQCDATCMSTFCSKNVQWPFEWSQLLERSFPRSIQMTSCPARADSCAWRRPLSWHDQPLSWHVQSLSWHDQSDSWHDQSDSWLTQPISLTALWMTGQVKYQWCLCFPYVWVSFPLLFSMCVYVFS